MPLADQTDVEALLGVTFTNQPEPRITALLDQAAAVVAGYIGHGYDGAPIVETFDGWDLDHSHKLYLRHTPDSVTSVVEDGTTLTVNQDWFEAEGTVYRITGGSKRLLARWARGWQNITVTYAMPAEAPDDIRHVVAGMVARLFVTREALANGGLARAGIAAEAIGDYRVTYDTGDEGELVVNGHPVLRKADMVTLSASGARPPSFA